MRAVSWRSRKDSAAFIQQRFNGGAIALVPAAPRGQQGMSLLGRESSSTSATSVDVSRNFSPLLMFLNEAGDRL
jgi:hypothetical protein